MRRRWAAAAGVAGLVVGAVGTLAIQPEPRLDVPLAAPTEHADVALPDSGGDVLLVWTPGGLPTGVVDALASAPGVSAATVVAGGGLDLVRSADADGHPVDEAPTGLAYPLDAIAVAVGTYPAFAPAGARDALADLRPGQVLLSATSARLRRLGAGGTLDLASGGRVTVAGVVADAVVGAAEVVVPQEWARQHGLLTSARYALVAHRGDRALVEAALRALVPAGTPVRIRGPGETPFLREGDAVLPQALIKERFGEFAVRRLGGTQMEQDPTWVADHIVTATVPLLGAVRCHRTVIPSLAGALRELEESNLGFLVDRTSFGGCWVAGLIRAGESPSRHSWGAAFDINVRKNPTGVASTQDPRLVAVMARWGFTSGATWLVPDAAYFEYVRPPDRR